MSPEDKSQVFLTGSSDRPAAIGRLFEHAGLGDLTGKRVALKANFNSADAFPASTHPDTVRAIVTLLKKAGACAITVADRSGMGDTRENLSRLGIFALAKELGFSVVVLPEERAERWTHVEPGRLLKKDVSPPGRDGHVQDKDAKSVNSSAIDATEDEVLCRPVRSGGRDFVFQQPPHGTHWQKGFYLTKVVLEADVVVQICCLKTHGYGGHFTMSLKNSVGLVAKNMARDDHDYMRELHGSPSQRLMVAEINAAYPVDFVIMDAAKAFIDGGPDRGTEVEPGLMLASKDRVALDAAGVALLREFGNTSLPKQPVFELDQIRRAAELGVGVGSAAAMELVPLDDQGRRAAERIQARLV